MHHTKVCYSRHALETCLVVQEASGGTCGFFDAACYQFYLRHLVHCLAYFQITLHAYALLPDRIWLLLTPRSPRAVENLLASVNRTYTAYFNARFSRGTKPWSRPHRQIPVRASAAVLVCQKLVELEPVHSGAVQHAGTWLWSSYSANAFGGRRKFVTRHRAVSGFLQQASDPGSHYRACIDSQFGQGQYEYLRNRIARNKSLAARSA